VTFSNHSALQFLCLHNTRHSGDSAVVAWRGERVDHIMRVICVLLEMEMKSGRLMIFATNVSTFYSQTALSLCQSNKKWDHTFLHIVTCIQTDRQRLGKHASSTVEAVFCVVRAKWL
jgi:hypothetical protein